MEERFKAFGYQVYRKRNLSYDEFKDCYRYLADYNDYPPLCRRLLLYFSGHGADGILQMQDEVSVRIEDILSCFKTDISRSKVMGGMVKMFFFDACRGSQRDSGYAVPIKVSDSCNWKIPKEGSILVAYASTPYHVSYKSSTGYGSRWTTHLVQALNESKENDDVCHVLTSANILMKKRAEMDVNEKGYASIEFQTAEFTSNLAEFVRFKEEANN